MLAFLAASLLLSVLEMGVVAPLATEILRRRITHARPGDAIFAKSLARSTYIWTDVVILALAGVVAGLLGHWLIGISLRLKGWPGTLALTAFSFITCAIMLAISS